MSPTRTELILIFCTTACTGLILKQASQQVFLASSCSMFPWMKRLYRKTQSEDVEFPLDDNASYVRRCALCEQKIHVDQQVKQLAILSLTVHISCQTKEKKLV